MSLKYHDKRCDRNKGSWDKTGISEWTRGLVTTAGRAEALQCQETGYAVGWEGKDCSLVYSEHYVHRASYVVSSFVMEYAVL